MLALREIEDATPVTWGVFNPHDLESLRPSRGDM